MNYWYPIDEYNRLKALFNNEFISHKAFIGISETNQEAQDEINNIADTHTEKELNKMLVDLETKADLKVSLAPIKYFVYPGINCKKKTISYWIFILKNNFPIEFINFKGERNTHMILPKYSYMDFLEHKYTNSQLNYIAKQFGEEWFLESKSNPKIHSENLRLAVEKKGGINMNLTNF